MTASTSKALSSAAADAVRVPAVPVDVGDLLDGGTPRQVPLDDQAAQCGPRCLEAGLDEVKLAGGGVGENEEQVFAEVVGDQPCRVGDVALAHTVGLRRVEGDVEDVDAVEHRDARGGGGQGRVARRESNVACRRAEVQNLDEQRADLASPLGRRGGEDAHDAVLHLNGVVTISDRHELDL